MKGQISTPILNNFFSTCPKPEEKAKELQKQTMESADEHDTEDDDNNGDVDNEVDDDDDDGDDKDDGGDDYEVDDDERLMERDCRDGQQDPRMADEQSP